LQVLKREFDVRKIHQEWKQQPAPLHFSQLKINDLTYGLATALQISCNRSHMNHSVWVSPKQTSQRGVKSDLCRYDINLKYCTTLQLMGVGGEHAAVLSAFLDLPEPHKWPRQFSVLEKYLFTSVDAVKSEAEVSWAEEEVSITIMDEDNVVN
jgi:hypothetical protein